jgi:hypothetical protein
MGRRSSTWCPGGWSSSRSLKRVDSTDGKREVQGIKADRVEEMRGVEAEDIQADGGASSSAAGEASLV